MNRQAIGGGRWFNRDTAARYEPRREFDGHNMVSVITRDWTQEQVLWITHGGKHILQSWSRWQVSRDRWAVISQDEAHRWLLAAGFEDEVPADALAKMEVQ